MKKLFVLFLLVALVPFTVGCGLFGDNDDTTPINMATKEVVLPQLFPPDFFGSLRAATNISLNFSDMIFNITIGATTVPMKYKSHKPVAAGVEVLFSRFVDETTFATIQTAGTVTGQVVIQPAGVTNPVVVVTSTSITVPTTLTSGVPVTTPSTPVTTVAVNTIANGITSQNSDLVVKTFKLVSVKYANAEVSTSATTAAPATNVTQASTINFAIEIDNAWTGTATPTFEVFVDNINTTVAAQTISTSNNLVKVIWNSDKKTATVEITNSSANGTQYMKTGETYSIALKSATIDTVKAAIPAARYIKIIQ